MPSSASSSFRSRGRHHPGRGVWISNKLCGCGEYTVLRTSGQPDTRGRVFHGCVNWKDKVNNGCSHFEWAINEREETTEHGLEEGLARLIECSEERFKSKLDDIKKSVDAVRFEREARCVFFGARELTIIILVGIFVILFYHMTMTWETMKPGGQYLYKANNV